MIRPFTILCFCAFAGAGAWLYQVKHQVATQDRELRDIRRQTEQVRDRSAILRAEWALLNEPDRLRQIATRHLPLEAMQPQHFARANEMERRLPQVVAFAGPPNLFAPPEPARGAPAVMLAAAEMPAPATRVVPASAATTNAVAARAAPEARPAELRGPEAPAPQALAAAVAAQRAARPAPAPAPPPARPAPLRDAAAPAPRPIQPAVHVTPLPAPEPATRTTRLAVPETTVVSSLGGQARPMLPPPVPFGSAAAATLQGTNGVAPPQPR